MILSSRICLVESLPLTHPPTSSFFFHLPWVLKFSFCPFPHLSFSVSDKIPCECNLSEERLLLAHQVTVHHWSLRNLKDLVMLHPVPGQKGTNACVHELCLLALLLCAGTPSNLYPWLSGHPSPPPRLSENGFPIFVWHLSSQTPEASLT